MNPIRRLYLRTRAVIWTAFSLVCILAALVVGVANLLLPYADRFREELAGWLEEELERPVSIDRIDAEWAILGPRVDVTGLAIGAPGTGDRLEISRGSVRFDVLAWLRPGSTGLRSLRMVVESLELTRGRDGVWTVGKARAGVPPRAGTVRATGEAWRWLANLRVTGFSARRLVLHDVGSGHRLTLPGGDLRLERTGRGLLLAGRFGDRETGELTVALEQPRDEATRLYLASEGLALPRWSAGLGNVLPITSGRLAFRLWTDLATRETRGSFTVEDVALTAPATAAVQGTTRLDSLTGDLFAWAGEEEAGVRLEELALRRGDEVLEGASLGLVRGGPHLRLTASQIPLGEAGELAAFLPGLPGAWRGTLAALAPKGRIANADLAVHVPGAGRDAVPTVTGDLALTGAGWRAHGALPGVSRLSLDARFEGRSARGRVRLDGGTVELAGLFRQAFEPLEASASFALIWTDAPRLRLEGIALRDGPVAARGRAVIELNEGRPFVDLAAIVAEAAPVAAAKRYWPVSIMPPPAVAWLDRALAAGRVRGGQVLLYGDLDDWPFDGREGRFTALADVEDLQLAFLPGWPALTAADGQVEFDPYGLQGRIDTGRLAGMVIGETDFDLPRFLHPILSIAVQGRTSGSAALAFLRDIPLDIPFRGFLDSLTVLTGTESEAWMQLDIPLVGRLGETMFTGHARVEDAVVRDTRWGIELAGTSGRVDFTRDGIEAAELRTRFRGEPATLSLRTGSFTARTDVAAEAVLGARSSLRALLREVEGLGPLLARLHGRTPWEARIAIPAEGATPELRLSLSLAGAEVDLPAPVAVAGELPVRIALPLDEPLTRITAELGDIGRLEARRPGGEAPWRVAVDFGSEPVAPPTEAGLTVTGRLAEVDLDAWLDLLLELTAPGRLTPGERLTLNRIALGIDALRVAGRTFRELELRSDREPTHWSLRLAGAGVDGRLRLPTSLDENRLILAEFEHLAWPEAGPAAGDLEATFDPRILPPMDFYAADFRLGETALGTVRFESHPTAEGMHIDRFATESPTLELNASGDWLAAGRSAFSATLSAADLGRTLREFGFRGVIEGGQLLAQLDAGWEGAPTDFELARMSGSLELTVGRGTISEVEPGAGRIFGLLSVQALPRRLLLDFSDLFGSGLSFDSITGGFTLAGGEARTDDLLVQGPTADVLIQGRIGLTERTYDQLITVVPKVGGTLPLVGAIAGGGMGAAALLVLQGVFGDEIERMTRYHYAVTGPWAEPELTLLTAGDPRLEPDRPRSPRETAAPEAGPAPGDPAAPSDDEAPRKRAEERPIEGGRREPQIPVGSLP